MARTDRKPCPGCNTQFNVLMTGNDGLFSVWCFYGGCKKRTKSFKMEEKAVEAWDQGEVFDANESMPRIV